MPSNCFCSGKRLPYSLLSSNLPISYLFNCSTVSEEISIFSCTNGPSTPRVRTGLMVRPCVIMGILSLEKTTSNSKRVTPIFKIFSNPKILFSGNRPRAPRCPTIRIIPLEPRKESSSGLYLTSRTDFSQFQMLLHVAAPFELFQ